MTSSERRCDWALGQAQISCPCVTEKTTSKGLGASREGRREGEWQGNKLLPSYHRRTVVTLWAEVACTVQYQLFVTNLPRLRPFCREQQKSLPQNLWHFLMTCQGRMSQHSWETRVRGKKSYKPWAKFMCVCIHLSVCVMCAFVCLCVCACAVGCKLQAIEWKSGILKAMGK